MNLIGIIASSKLSAIAPFDVEFLVLAGGAGGAIQAAAEEEQVVVVVQVVTELEPLLL